MEKKFWELENKILNTGGLVTTTAPTKKIGKVERKIPDINGLVAANVPNTKTGEVEKKILDHAKYVATLEFNKFAGKIFHERLKQAKLPTTTDLNTVEKHAIENDKKTRKIEKQQTLDLSFFFLAKKRKSCYLFFNRKEICKFKPNNKNANFLTQFFLGSICNKFDTVGSIEVSLKECMIFNSITVLLINLIY